MDYIALIDAFEFDIKKYKCGIILFTGQRIKKHIDGN